MHRLSPKDDINPHYAGHSEIHFHSVFDYLLEIAKDNITQVWKYFDNHFKGRQMTIPPHLGNVEKLPIGTLIESMEASEFMGFSSETHIYVLYGVVSLLTVIVTVAGLYMVIECTKGSRKSRNYKQLRVEYVNQGDNSVVRAPVFGRLYPELPVSPTVTEIDACPRDTYVACTSTDPTPSTGLLSFRHTPY